MRGGVRQPGQRFLTATEKVWTKYLAFCSCYKVPTLFRILQKMSLWTGGVAISKHFTHYMYVPRSAFRIITWQLPIKRDALNSNIGEIQFSCRRFADIFSMMQDGAFSFYMGSVVRSLQSNNPKNGYLK